LEQAEITFAIPFYGSVDYLRLTLDSVRAQTVDTWRALVVDDLSPTEDARYLVASFADPRITYVRNNENLGLGGNWNRCVELSDTSLITLLHGDDELMPHYAEQMLTAHQRWPDAAAVFCPADIIDARGVPMFSFRDHVKRWLLPKANQPFVLEGEAGVRSLLLGNFIMCPTLCYKKTLFNDLRFSPEWRMVLDVDFYLRALMRGHRLVGLVERGYRYRRHEGQVTTESERNLRIFTEEIALWRRSAADARHQGWPAAARVADKMRIIKLQLSYYILGDLLKLQFGPAKGKLQLLGRLLRGDSREAGNDD